MEVGYVSGKGREFVSDGNVPYYADVGFGLVVGNDAGSGNGSKSGRSSSAIRSGVVCREPTFTLRATVLKVGELGGETTQNPQREACSSAEHQPWRRIKKSRSIVSGF